MSEYHKIETLYERDEATHRLKQPLVLKNRVYGIVDPWVFTEKIDGTNVRCMWDGSKVTFGGKTDAEQLHADLVKWLYENVTPEKFSKAFSMNDQPTDDMSPPTPVILYGEGYGSGIQNGGGYSPTKKFILFDVLVHGADGHKWWLSDENVRDIASKMGLDAVPLVGTMTLAAATEMVRAGLPSAIGDGTVRAEGLVGRPAEALFDKKGHRLIVKLKTKDF